MALQRVDTSPIQLAAYEGLAESALLEQVRALAAQLAGLRVVHISATPTGGGVAEILRSCVPLLRDVGVNADWYVLPPDTGFFSVTKHFHNQLQGERGRLTTVQRETYVAYLARVAEDMRDLRADVWVIHDPQPLALRDLVPLHGPAVWRCHIDCSHPEAAIRKYVQQWVHGYDRAIFSMPEYILPGLQPEQVRIMHPAIDPLVPKNCVLSRKDVVAILSDLGIDPARPLMTQVSRFDPWKNPWQVIDAYRLAKLRVPGLQLAMVGVFEAKDDPQGPEVYRSIQRYVGSDPDVHLFVDPSRVGGREVNAFQTGASVVLQRSTREGFGLTVTEAMWKARPVVATPVGGITAQIDHEQTGYVVSSTEECADWAVQLVSNPELSELIGTAARQRVSAQFLLPRLVRDDLQMYHELTRKDAMDAAA